MPHSIPVTTNIDWVGVNDWETERFENLWPLPHGITYNAFLIRDDKTALIDTIKGGFSGQFLKKVTASLPPGRALDYLVINHMEPDHSGAIQQLRARYPELVILGNKKTARFLDDFYAVTDNIRIIEDNDTLPLGRHTLRFIMTPMVHWPETMMTYESSEKILFSGDAFGSFGALDGTIFDDTIFNLEDYEGEILRYYSNVIGRYSTMVQKALARIAPLDLAIIASTHGPVWRTHPDTIRALYDGWSRHQTETGAVIAYGSMYGNTEQMMEAVGKGLADSGITGVAIHNVSKSHPSFILRDIWRYRALILGTPTYNMKPFPLVDNLVQLLRNKMMEKRLLGVFGSCGWSGGGVKGLMEFASEERGWELVDPVVEARCAPKDADLAQCHALGKNMAQRLQR